MNPQDLLANADFVSRLSRRLVFDEHRSDDVVQETWLAALRAPPEEGRPVRSWLSWPSAGYFFSSTLRWAIFWPPPS